jgi:hypothetical protein
MSYYEGAIDYMILKNNHQYIVFFLDNHNPKQYCDIPGKNISKLFELYLHKNTTFIFEELVDESNFLFVFQHVLHLKEYLLFYNKHKTKKNIHPIDLRIIFNDIDNKKIFNTIEHLFSIFSITKNKTYDIHINKSASNCSHEKFNFIVNKIESLLSNKSHPLLSVFIQHFGSLYEQFMKIKIASENNVIKQILIKNNEEKYFSRINLSYPFNTHKTLDTNCISEEYNDLLSAFLEFYTITIILSCSSDYVFLYLGASHCIILFNLLNKYYHFRDIKTFKNINLKTIDYFELDNFNSCISCIDFSQIH